MIWDQPQSAGPVRYLLTGHLWTGPRLSTGNKIILTVNASVRKSVQHLFYFKSGSAEGTVWDMMSAQAYLGRSFDITVHEEALNGVGLGYNRFLHVFLGVCSFGTRLTCK